MPEAYGLTAKQRQALLFVRAFMAQSGGVAPSYEEIRQALGVASKSNVFRVVSSLEQRGFIRRIHKSTRSISLTEAALNA